MLQSMGSQRVGHDLTEQQLQTQQNELISPSSNLFSPISVNVTTIYLVTQVASFRVHCLSFLKSRGEGRDSCVCEKAHRKAL